MTDARSIIEEIRAQLERNRAARLGMPNPARFEDRDWRLALEIIHALVCQAEDSTRKGPGRESGPERARLMVVPMRESA